MIMDNMLNSSCDLTTDTQKINDEQLQKNTGCHISYSQKTSVTSTLYNCVFMLVTYAEIGKGREITLTDTSVFAVTSSLHSLKEL